MIFIPDGQSLSVGCKFTKVDLTEYIVFYNLGCSEQQSRYILDSILELCNDRLHEESKMLFRFIFSVTGTLISSFNQFPTDAKAMVVSAYRRFQGLTFEESLPESQREIIYLSAAH